jgi:hypothetical protein
VYAPESTVRVVAPLETTLQRIDALYEPASLVEVILRPPFLIILHHELPILRGACETNGLPCRTGHFCNRPPVIASKGPRGPRRSLKLGKTTVVPITDRVLVLKCIKHARGTHVFVQLKERTANLGVQESSCPFLQVKLLERLDCSVFVREADQLARLVVIVVLVLIDRIGALEHLPWLYVLV